MFLVLVWDFYVLAGLGLGFRDYAARLDALPWPRYPQPSPNDFLPKAWAGESCRLIETRALYPAQPAIDHGYLDSMRPLAEQRLRQAAWRLAQLLDQTLAR